MGAARDQFNNLKGKLGVEPQALGVATAVGEAIDIQGFEAMTFFASMGAAGVGDLTIEESDDGTTGWTTAGVDDVLGTNVKPLIQSDVVSLGYVGNKQFARASITLTTGGDISCPAILGYPHIATVQ